jgi:hypothetical protein
VSGDVRQTAEIAFGAATDEEYIDLKNYAKNPQRAAHGWTRYEPARMHPYVHHANTFATEVAHCVLLPMLCCKLTRVLSSLMSSPLQQ